MSRFLWFTVYFESSHVFSDRLKLPILMSGSRSSMQQLSTLCQRLITKKGRQNWGKIHALSK